MSTDLRSFKFCYHGIARGDKFSLSVHSSHHVSWSVIQLILECLSIVAKNIVSASILAFKLQQFKFIILISLCVLLNILMNSASL